MGPADYSELNGSIACADYRATWINTAIDAGFATAMPIQPKPLRDLFSVLFSFCQSANTSSLWGRKTQLTATSSWIDYLVYSSDADEKVRRYRALSTVEFLRGRLSAKRLLHREVLTTLTFAATWEKQTNPIFRFFTAPLRPKLPIKQKLSLPRPYGSPYSCVRCCACL